MGMGKLFFSLEDILVEVIVLNENMSYILPSSYEINCSLQNTNISYFKRKVSHNNGIFL